MILVGGKLWATWRRYGVRAGSEPINKSVQAPTTRPHSASELLDIADAATYLDTSERHLRRLYSERRIAFVKVGKYIRFIRSDLDAFIASRRIEPLP
jgi:excisionase family DNA binding protein